MIIIIIIVTISILVMMTITITITLATITTVVINVGIVNGIVSDYLVVIFMGIVSITSIDAYIQPASRFMAICLA